MKTGASRTSARGVLLLWLLVAGGCATQSFEVRDIEAAGFIERMVTQEEGAVRVSATVPTAEETLAMSGLDLYSKGIQPVWLKVENNEPRGVRVAHVSVDDEYYSPMEVAWYFRKGYSKDGKRDMERWFYENTMPRLVPPGESRSGLIFTHLGKGTKGFNVDAYTTEGSFNFTFFVTMPGFEPDYMDVPFAELYGPDDIRNVDVPGLRDLLSDFDCCSLDAAGVTTGDPFNVVFVGTPKAMRRALLGGQWQETQSSSADSALARLHHMDGRVPDGTFHKARPDGSERKELRIWLSPIRVDGVPVWLAQASYDMSGSRRTDSFEDYQIDPDIDDARMFVLQSFWYSQSLAKFGMASGVPGTSINAPRQNFTGNTWFTDGARAVLFIAEEPIAMDETEFLRWESINE